MHPDIGIALAQKWSGHSRISNDINKEDSFKGEEGEWLWEYCRTVNLKMHFDYFIFGHRHLPLELPVEKDSLYINLGEWVSQFTYGEFDGHNFHLNTFDK
jgi:UDP-2,3-diacylglucosamine hydrolase